MGSSFRATACGSSRRVGNLVANAPTHGDGAVTVSARPRDGAVELHVEDEGEGLPPGFAERAFERFTRADEARGGGGAGLGLAIVAAIARAHGGRAGFSPRESGHGRVDRAAGSHRILIRAGYNRPMTETISPWHRIREHRRRPGQRPSGRPGPVQGRVQRPHGHRQPLLPLTEFDRCVLRGKEDGARVRVVRTPLDRTKTFMHQRRAVRAAVIEDREFEDGELVERTLDYFAQDDRGTVWYLGEDVDKYRERQGRRPRRRVAVRQGHEQDGRRDARAPAGRVALAPRGRAGRAVRDRQGRRDPRQGDRARQDLPRRAEGARADEPDDEVEFKLYAPGVGNIQERPPDGRLGLVGCS